MLQEAWRLKRRATCVEMGDKNSIFFSYNATKRRKENIVGGLGTRLEIISQLSQKLNKQWVRSSLINSTTNIGFQ